MLGRCFRIKEISFYSLDTEQPCEDQVDLILNDYKQNQLLASINEEKNSKVEPVCFYLNNMNAKYSNSFVYSGIKRLNEYFSRFQVQGVILEGLISGYIVTTIFNDFPQIKSLVWGDLSISSADLNHFMKQIFAHSPQINMYMKSNSFLNQIDNVSDKQRLNNSSAAQVAPATSISSMQNNNFSMEEILKEFDLNLRRRNLGLMCDQALLDRKMAFVQQELILRQKQRVSKYQHLFSSATSSRGEEIANFQTNTATLEPSSMPSAVTSVLANQSLHNSSLDEGKPPLAPHRRYSIGSIFNTPDYLSPDLNKHGQRNGEQMSPLEFADSVLKF